MDKWKIFRIIALVITGMALGCFIVILVIMIYEDKNNFVNKPDQPSFIQSTNEVDISKDVYEKHRREELVEKLKGIGDLRFVWAVGDFTWSAYDDSIRIDTIGIIYKQ